MVLDLRGMGLVALLWVMEHGNCTRRLSGSQAMVFFFFIIVEGDW